MLYFAYIASLLLPKESMVFIKAYSHFPPCKPFTSYLKKNWAVWNGQLKWVSSANTSYGRLSTWKVSQTVNRHWLSQIAACVPNCQAWLYVLVPAQAFKADRPMRLQLPSAVPPPGDWSSGPKTPREEYHSCGRPPFTIPVQGTASLLIHRQSQLHTLKPRSATHASFSGGVIWGLWGAWAQCCPECIARNFLNGSYAAGEVERMWYMHITNLFVFFFSKGV